MDDTMKSMSNMFSGNKEMKKEPATVETKPDQKRFVMSMNEITHSLHERLEDEIQDALDYLSMACSAKQMGHWDLAENLLHIAFDEHHHASCIYEVLMFNGVPVDEDIKTEYEAMMSRFRNIYFVD